MLYRSATADVHCRRKKALLCVDTQTGVHGALQIGPCWGAAMHVCPRSIMQVYAAVQEC